MVLNTNDFQKLLAKYQVNYVKGDWTEKNPEVTKILTHYQRAGVPLYVVIPKNQPTKGVILSEILTLSAVESALKTLESSSLENHGKIITESM